MTLTRRTLAASTLVAAFAAPALVRAQEPFAAAKAYSDARRGVSLLIRKAGRTLHESYAGGGGAARGWELASGTKSFCGVLAAAMVQDGMLSLDELCAETLTEWRADEGKASIRIRDLLTLTSGVGGGELGRPPPYAEAVAAPLTAPPRTRFIYGPAPFQAFGEIVRRKLVAAGEPGDVLAFMQRRILTPFGVTPISWRKREGQPTMPSGAQVTARDWAAFGTVVMAGGDGRVDAPTLAACFEGTSINPGYGLTWWLLRPGLIGPGRRSGLGEEGAAMARIADVRMAAGAGNQRLYLIPDRDLIVVRQASGVLAALRGDDAGWSDADFLRMVLAEA
ncbi:MAG: serine hydrolase domain-containing protein [Pseudomonadota bacterium]